MSEEQHVERAYKTYQIVGLFLGPLIFAALYLSPAPPGLSGAGWATAALALWMAIWWTTDAVPLFVTALLPLVFLPLLGVADIGTAAEPFADPVIFLLLGGFLLGLAVERWNLHRRIAFHIIRRVGTRPIGLLGGVMLATAAISMWISNTATTVMMLPIAISLIVAVLPPGRSHGPEGANFAAAMTLGVAYAASIGGMATLIGSPPNALAAGYLSQAFKIVLDFGVWMAIALPIAAVMLGLAFFVLSRVAFPFPTLEAPDTQAAVDLLRQTERMSAPERRVAIVFAVVIACWILYPWVEAQTGRKIGDAVIAVAGAIALFLVPADWRRRTFLLDYATARKAPWDIFILFGGGLSLAQAMQNSGLAAWIGNGLSFLHGMPLIVLIAGVSLLLVFMTELISNTAAAAAFLPVAGSLVIGGDAPPVVLVVTVALAASCGFMLPVGTVPNALVFGTGYIPLPKMVRAGFILDLLSAAVITAGIALAALLLGAGDARAEDAPPPARHVNQQRLQTTLEKLSEFGRNPEGGVTRLGFSQADLDARAYVISLMADAGLEVRVDPAGNIFGRRAGSEQLPTLLFGSHIDSVPHGGNFDGPLGSLGAIEVIRALNDALITTRHPLEVVIWTNEEGPHFGISALGSGVAAGELGAEILERKDDDGLTVADWLRRYGQDPARLTDARIAPGALAAILELHIEQGPVLDESKVQIGVVSGIVSLKRWKCVTTGLANHAGTTPMNRRKDALAAAAKHLLAVREAVRAETGAQVGTVGYMKAEPGAPNVIPGRVEFPVELRDLDAAKVERMWEQIQEKFAEADKEEGVETACEVVNEIAAAPSDPAVRSAIREAAQSAGLSTVDLPSGAVHDAGEISKIAPMGMIFVPSRDGISHAPQEFTAPEDCANGVEVLYRSVLLLDQLLQPN